MEELFGEALVDAAQLVSVLNRGDVLVVDERADDEPHFFSIVDERGESLRGVAQRCGAEEPDGTVVGFRDAEDGNVEVREDIVALGPIDCLEAEVLEH